MCNLTILQKMTIPLIEEKYMIHEIKKRIPTCKNNDPFYDEATLLCDLPMNVDEKIKRETVV